MDERLKKYSRVVTQHVSDELPNFCSLGPFIGLMGGRESSKKILASSFISRECMEGNRVYYYLFSRIFLLRI